jgi:iron complex transport system substrate-binding protein
MATRILALLFVLYPLSSLAIEVVDDSGVQVHLDKPAQRIISLAPHVTELLFEAGAGQQIVGVVSYSDFPEAARGIPRVGDYQKLDMERIAGLQPDLLVAWQTGNRAFELQRLKKLGFVVFQTEPRQLTDIADLLQRLGQLAGTQPVAAQSAAQFLQRYQSLANHYQDKQTLRAFYQIWDQPLMTINGQHLISDVMRLCGLSNVFATLPSLVPRVSQEAVLKADPQIIIAGGMSEVRPDWARQWRRWRALSATRLDALYDINPDHIQRQTPRILLGAEEICQLAEITRQKLTSRKKNPN